MQRDSATLNMPKQRIEKAILELAFSKHDSDDKNKILRCVFLICWEAESKRRKKPKTEFM